MKFVDQLHHSLTRYTEGYFKALFRLIWNNKVLLCNNPQVSAIPGGINNRLTSLHFTSLLEEIEHSEGLNLYSYLMEKLIYFTKLLYAKTALIDIILFHSKKMLFSTYIYSLIFTVTPAQPSLQLILLNLKLSGLSGHFFLSKHLGGGINQFIFVW